MKKLVVLSAYVFSICIMFAGFGVVAPQAASVKKPVVRTTVQPILGGFHLWYAEKYGTLKDAPFAIDLMLFTSGGPQIEALAAKHWDCGSMGAIPTMIAGLRYGYKLIGISANESPANDMWVRPDSPMLKTKGANPKHPNIYGTVNDWKGKKILSTTMSTGHYALTSTLKTMGLNDNDVSIIHMEQGQALAAFSAGQGDIIQLWAPYSYIALERGWVQVSSGESAGVMIIGAAGVSKSFAEEHPDLVVEWLDQHMQSVEKAKRSNVDMVDPLLYFFNNFAGLQLTREQAAMEFVTRGPLMDVQEQVLAMDDPDMLAAWMRGVAQFLLDQKRISQKEFDAYAAANYYIDSSFMKKVAARRAAGK